MLLVHQGGELYGSDMVFLMVVDALNGPYAPFVVLAEDGPLRSKIAARGVDVRVMPLGVIRREAVSASGVLRLIKLTNSGAGLLADYARELHARLVYSNTGVVLSGAFAAHRARLPHVWHIHETIERPRLAAPALALLAARRSSRIVAVSQATADNLAKHHRTVATRTVVVPNGLSPQRVPTVDRADMRRGLGLAPDESVVILVGRMSARKGHLVLIEAFTKLPDSVKARTTLMFVGDVFRGNEAFRAELRRRIDSAGIRERAILTGFRTDVADLLNASDVAVIPSVLSESAPTVALEAMAAGLPVVASRVGGIPEIVIEGETGYLVPAGDAAALSKTLQTLLQNPGERSRLGERGRVRVEKHFSMEKFNGALLEVVDEVVSSHPASLCCGHLRRIPA